MNQLKFVIIKVVDKIQRIHLYVGIFSIVIFFSTHVAACIENDYRDGLYSGIVLGYDNIQSNYHFRDLININPPAMNIVDHTYTQFGSENGLTGIVAGYTKTVYMPNFNKPFIVGLDLAALYTPLRVHYKSSSTTYLDGSAISQVSSEDFSNVNFTSNYTLSSAIRFGCVIFPKTQTYLLLGAVYNNFKATIGANGRVLRSDGSYFNSVPYSHSFDQNKIGLLAGLGVETYLSRNMSLRLEYSHASYGRLKNNDQTCLSYEDAGNVTHLCLGHLYDFDSITRGQLLAALSYHFGSVSTHS